MFSIAGPPGSFRAVFLVAAKTGFFMFLNDTTNPVKMMT